MSFFSNTWINGASMPQVVLGAGGGSPPLDERYFTQLDGQSKYWRRIEPDYGQTTNATLECLFYGGSGSGLRYLEGRHSDDRFYIALQDNEVMFGNGANGGLSPTVVSLTKINHAKLVADGTNITFFVNAVQIIQVPQLWSGLLDEVGFGVKGDQLQNFYDGILVSARVTTDTVDNVYGLDSNLPYDLAEGTTDPLADSTLIFENGSVDGSDRLLVTENAEVGFLGDDKWFDAIKAVTGQATVPTDDSITIDEVGGTLAGVAINTPAAPITVTGDCDLISGQVDISVIPALAGVAASITQSGPFSFDLDSQGALGFKRAFSGGAQAVITNIKVKLRYDYATGANPDAGTYSSEYSSEYS